MSRMFPHRQRRRCLAAKADRSQILSPVAWFAGICLSIAACFAAAHVV